ncbi:metal ABC transporter permease [Actinomyces bovis]|nr:metal ABC transporter permease [Actinomyces bovis]
MSSSVSWSLLGLPTLEVALMGALAGLVGALALVHRRVFLTESLTHATFPGAVAGVVIAAAMSQALMGERAGYELLTLALLAGAVAMCLPMIGLTRWLATIPGLSAQSAAGIVLTSGFALGYLLVKWFAPLPLKVDSFLAGSVLNVSRLDVWVTGAVLAIAVLVCVVGGRLLTFYGFDPVGYQASGMRAAPCEAAVLGLICLTIAALVPAVGTILPIALVAAPAAALARWCTSMRTLLVGAATLGTVTCLVGLAAGVMLELSVGGVIALACALVYAGSEAVAAWRD